jgi:acyl dehydratase
MSIQAILEIDIVEYVCRVPWTEDGTITVPQTTHDNITRRNSRPFFELDENRNPIHER